MLPDNPWLEMGNPGAIARRHMTVLRERGYEREPLTPTYWTFRINGTKTSSCAGVGEGTEASLPNGIRDVEARRVAPSISANLGRPDPIRKLEVAQRTLGVPHVK